jgi:membrane protein
VRRKALVGLAIAAAIAALPDPRKRRPGAPAPAARAVPISAPIPVADVPAVPTPEAPGLPRRVAGVLVAAVRHGLATNATDVAASLAYYAFLAIPAALLVAVGVFGLVAGRGTIRSVIGGMDGVVPQSALSLIDDSLTRVTESSGGGGALAIVGLVLALWTSSGAMNALMRGLNRVHGCRETRSFVRQRATALALFGWVLLAVVVSFGLLVLGAPLSSWVGGLIGAETVVTAIWWAAQWPILAIALLVAFTGILRSGPADGSGDMRAAVAGAAVSVVIWLVASGLFAVYVAGFSSYGAAWGSLSAVIVMLTWLWLTSLAVLLGSEVELEVARRRRSHASGTAGR